MEQVDMQANSARPDGQDWLPCRCERVRRPRGPARVLLPCARSQSARLFTHFASLQGTLLDGIMQPGTNMENQIKPI